MTTDRNGQRVTVGTKIRLLQIDASVTRDLPAHEREELSTMVGRVFEVYEVDEHGAAWIEKTWRDDEGQHSRSLALDPHEMEIA